MCEFSSFSFLQFFKLMSEKGLKYFISKDSSWNNCTKLLFKFQRRLYKSFYVQDLKSALIIQKFILKSNCARLLSIRYVTQVSLNKRIPGIDGKVSLTFSERFQLNELLKKNVYKWQPKPSRSHLVSNKEGNFETFNVFVISDRVWQSLVNFSLEPIHEVLFYPNNLGFRFGRSFYEVQKRVFFNLNRNSLGKLKRVLQVDVAQDLSSFNNTYLLRKLLAPRSIKVGLFKFFKSGFKLGFINVLLDGVELENLLANVLLTDLDFLHNSIRYGSRILYFLRPLDNEVLLLNRLKSFSLDSNLDFSKFSLSIIDPFKGFDLLGWNFKLSPQEFLISTPSNSYYQNFIRRIKRIINNSNYGSLVKANKLFPLIKEWKLYHRFCSSKGYKVSLYDVKRKAFKVFSKETKQDFYSTQTLINKCFFVADLKEFLPINETFSRSPYYGHMIFWINLGKSKKFYCIHCGLFL